MTRWTEEIAAAVTAAMAEAREVPAKPEPTPMTVIVHSTPMFGNQTLFVRTLDQCLVWFEIVHVVAEEGSQAAHLSRHWCRQNRIRYTEVLRDATISERNDRKRRHEQMLSFGPHFVLIFNLFDRWQEFATRMHEAGVPVSIVRPKALDDNAPKFTTWAPGMTNIGPTPTLKALTQHVRNARKGIRVTKEHAAEVKRAATARHDAKRRLIKIMKRIQNGTLAEHAWRFRPRKQRRAITPAGHRPSSTS